MIDIASLTSYAGPYAKQVYSQRGEDGIIECIFQHVSPSYKTCCEFGAWDGTHLSNVMNLITQDWKAYLFEGDQEKFKQLQVNMSSRHNVYCGNKYISLEAGEKLSELLLNAGLPPGEELDLLSIDIDSYDYWIWASYPGRPKVVVIEYNSNWIEDVTLPYNRQQLGWAGNSYFGASAKALARLGASKGYSLIGFQPFTNLFFLREELAQDFIKLDLSIGNHIQSPHHGPLTQEQRESLVFNPPTYI